jgi:hypothetical protein
MRRQIHAGFGGWRGAGMIAVMVFDLAGRVFGGDFPPGFNPENFEVRTYASNSTREIADCKVEKIFLDHRSLGFFKVKLLPVLVVQGLRVDFGDAISSNEWVDTFQSNWLPKVERRAVQWHDVGIGSQAPGAPRLHAASAEPAKAGTPTVCTFKDVTLEAYGQKWRMPQAELRSEEGRPRVVWKSGGVERRMDLFSGEIYGN